MECSNLKTQNEVDGSVMNVDVGGSARNVDDEGVTGGRRLSVVLSRVQSVEDLVRSRSGSRTRSRSNSAHPSESDSDGSMMSVQSSSSKVSTSKPDIRPWLKRPRGEDDEEASSSPKVATTPRGRGRPATSGHYVGLAKAKADANAALEAEIRLQAEKEMADEAARKKERADAVLLGLAKAPSATSDDSEAKELAVLVQESVDTILNVARTSGKLKGTYVKALKDAAETIKVSVAEMRARTVPEEVVRLEAANARMMRELQELRKEMAALRAERAQPAPPPSKPMDMEEFMAAAMVQFGTMVNARFAGLEERLLPEKRVRPPLAADLRRERLAAETAADRQEEARPPSPVQQAPLEPPKTSKGKGKGKGKKKAATVAAAVEAGPSAVAEPQTSQKETPQLWTEVVRKGGRPKNKVARPATAKAASREVKAAKPVQPQSAKPKAAKLRSHRAAAVVVTLLPGAEEKGLTYKNVLAEARSRMDLKAMDMPPLNMRTAATGARIIEVPGSERVEKADLLATKMREVLKEAEGVVSVSRPVTTADLRVSGLDDSVTASELVESLARAGGCPESDIKAGEVRSGPGGMGTAFVRCPVTAARKLVDNGGRLLVGWVAARVQVLDARPRRCYKCLELGHVRAQCKSEVDRSDHCYRCGQKGHKANDCSAAPHCTLCAAVGKAADHLSGGKACAKPPSKKGAKKKAAAKVKPQPSRPEQGQAEQMET